LLDADSYQRVFKEAHRSRDKLFTVLSRESRGKGARLGLAISKKNCRLAAQRNRLKRIVRESFRSHKDTLGGLDFVVMCQTAASRARNKELFDSLAEHWQRSQAAIKERKPEGRELDG
jgi:ribonuclease P protein component